MDWNSSCVDIWRDHVCQGHAIFHGKYGYKHTDREKQKMSK